MTLPPNELVKPPFFIVGCQRSGTSLLRSLLRSHPNLTAPPESHFIPRCYRAYGDPANESEARRLARVILSTTWVKEWELDVTPDDFADCRDYRDLVCRLYEAYSHKEGKPRWGDKTPQYVREIPTLLRLFPEAKIIHVIRDGRDVALSWLRTRSHPHNYYTAAQLWERWVRQGMGDGRPLLRENYHEVHYEGLLDHPAATMRGVCGFLDEPYVDDVLRLSPTPKEVRSGDLWQISHTEVVRNNSGKWRSKLSPAERALFESIAGDLLASLGYEVEGRARGIPQWERLFWRVHQEVNALVTLAGNLRRPDRLRTRLLLRLLDARGKSRDDGAASG